MYSVTRRVNSVKQPHGGYVNPSDFEKIELESDTELREVENVHSGIVGIAVDYLSRYVSGEDVYDAFLTSYNGAILSDIATGVPMCADSAVQMLDDMGGLEEDLTIINALRLATFDIWTIDAMEAVNRCQCGDIHPDRNTIFNVREMVKRTMKFLETYGPMVESGVHFYDQGYSSLVSSGEADFITHDTLWDIKTTKGSLTSKHTLQVLMYYLMGKSSDNPVFEDIKYIGIFNPRQNIAYRLNVENISKDVIEEVESGVIGYIKERPNA